MKAVLIVFMAFQYDGGVASSTVTFNGMEQCVAAKAAIEREHQAAKQRDGWGRVRIVAVCAPLEAVKP